MKGAKRSVSVLAAVWLVLVGVIIVSLVASLIRRYPAEVLGLSRLDISGTPYLIRFALALLVLIINGFLLVMLWQNRYPHRSKLIPVVAFYPPEGFNPTELGFLIDGHVNVQDIGALFFYWASQGYLSIEEKPSGGFALTRQKDMGAECATYEQYAFRALWRLGDGTHVDDSEIKNNYYRQVRDVWNSIRRKYEEPDNRLFEKTAKAPLFLAAAICLLGLAMMAATSAFESDFVKFAMLSMTMIFGVGYTFMCLALKAIYENRYIRKPWQTWGYYGLIALVLLITAGVCVSAMKDALSVVIALLLLAMPIIDIWAVLRFKRYTEHGFEWLKKAVGFKNFIQIAEKDKLNTLLSDDPGYAYRVLPYAIVLKTTQAWSSRLSILSAQQPDWYWRFGTGTFTSESLAEHMNQTAWAVSSAAVTKKPFSRR